MPDFFIFCLVASLGQSTALLWMIIVSPAHYGRQVVPPPARQGGVMVESVDELLEKLRNEAGVLE